MKTRLLFLLFVFVASFPISTSLVGQQNTAFNVQVTGLVLDSITEESVPYATIKIYDKLTPQTVEKVTPSDADGKFSFAINKKGSYLMTVEFTGKQTAQKEFSVENDKKIDLGTVWIKDNSQFLNEVVVSAQKPLVKMDLDKITYNVEDDPESKTDNVLDMLKKVPMVTVDGEDNIELKGSTSFKIYVNGKPSNMISSNPKDILKSMPANTVKEIEVITDPGAKYDAEGVAGIINIITHKNASMIGYNARINTYLDSWGDYRVGGNLTLKAGKFGFMGNYNLYEGEQPESSTYYHRENFKNTNERYIYQNGKAEGKGKGHFGSGEISYEIDTLNLINVGFNLYQGDWKQKRIEERDIQNAEFISTQEYLRRIYSKNVFGSTGVNVDYQRTSAKIKDRLFTVSYRFNHSPNETFSDNHEEAIFNYIENRNKQYSDGKMNEHTFQVDYTTPFAKIHTLETGIKYIIRLNESTSGYHSLDENGVWTERKTNNDKFKHQQDIVSGYLGYSAKLKKFGLKTGLRYEYTDVQGKYPLSEDDNFEANYSNLVPSATVTYKLKDTQTFRLGHNMRIRRPSIGNLNPYPNTSDTLNIRFGNPKLDAVKSYTFNFNYSYFNPKLNFNTNLSYDFTNNNVEPYSYIEDKVTKTTYLNIGKNKRVNLHTYVNWNPSKKFRLNMNLSGSYTDMRSNNELGLKNSGFQGRIHTNVSYTLPLKFIFNGYYGYNSPRIRLQGEGNSNMYHGISLRKDFIDEKLNVNVTAGNPFKKRYKYKNETFDKDFYILNEQVNKRQYFGIYVSFRFGEMKSKIQKTRRGISNDDSMNGNSNGGQGGQGEQGAQ